MTRTATHFQGFTRLALVLAIVQTLVLACGSQATQAPPPTPTPMVSSSLDSAEAYLERGDAYAGRQKWEQAIAEYDQAIRLKPDYAEAYNNRGYAYYWKGPSTQAIADLSKALELRPDYPYAYNTRGAAYMASGHPEQAIPDFNRAIELQPEFPQAYTNRGNAYLRTGRLDLALADFRRAGKNPVGTIVLLCGVPGLMVLLAAGVINHLLRRRHHRALQDGPSLEA